MQIYNFIFHGAKAGRKYQLAKSNPMVGFEIDGCYEIMKATAVFKLDVEKMTCKVK